MQVSISLISGSSSHYSTRPANNRLKQKHYELERTANTITTLEQCYLVFSTSAEHIRTYVEWFQTYARLQFYADRFLEEDVLVLSRHLLAEAR